MILEEKGDKIICKGARILDSDEIPIEELIKAVYHECRHIWQIENYPDIWSWWVFGSKENYIKFIDEPICAIEYDAWKFGESYGEEMHYEILLKAISVKILDKFKDNLDYLNSELYKASKGESKIFKFITK